MDKFWIITLEVYRKYVKSPAFWVTVLLPVIMIGSITLITKIIVSSFSTVHEAAVLSEDAMLIKAFQEVKQDTLRFQFSPSLESAKSQLKHKNIAAYLTVENKDGLLYGTVYTDIVLSPIDSMTIQQTLNAVQRELIGKKLHLTPDETAQLSIPAQLDHIHIDFSESGSGREGADYSAERLMLCSLLNGFILMVIMMYAGFICQEIVSEKGTRIMEIMLSSAKAETHFYAKLTGTSLVCLTEIGIYLLIGVSVYPHLKNIEMLNMILTVNFSDIFGGLFIFSLPVLLFSVLLYIILAALSGSLASSMEEVSYAIQPVTGLALIGYTCSFIFANDPQHTVMKIISYVPFWSGFAMPLRTAYNGANLREVLFSLGLLITADLLLLLFSARLYKSNVLIYSTGGLIKALKQSLAGIKAEKA